MSRFDDRLRRIEAARARRASGGPRIDIVPAEALQAGDLPDLAGCRGMVVPELLPHEQWEQFVAEQQPEPDSMTDSSDRRST